MTIEEVKRNLNRLVIYKPTGTQYKFTGCMLRKNDSGYYYHQAEITHLAGVPNIIWCKLEDIEPIEQEGKT